MDNLEQNKQSTSIAALMLVQALLMRELCRVSPESTNRLRSDLKGYLAYMAEIIKADTSRPTYDGELKFLQSLVQQFLDSLDLVDSTGTATEAGRATNE